jgi:translocation and assembly module TamA
MGQTEQRALAGALVLTSVLALAAPAFGLTIFGIRLWGDEPADEVEIIDPLPYTVSISVITAREGVQRSVEAASGLWTDRAAPASGRAGLIARARGDYRRILAALYNAGFYGPDISIRVAGREASEITLADPLPAEVPVEIIVVPGPRFRFGIAQIVNAPPWVDGRGEPVEEDPASVGFAVGEPARAGAVGAAASLAVDRWRELGHALADEVDREIIADHATNQLEATIVLDPGRLARYGEVAVSGTQRMRPAFVRYIADLEPGDRFRPQELADAQARLVRLGTFTRVTIAEGEEIGPDGSLPMTIDVEERAPRSFGVGATLGTLDGLGLEGFWLHRNLGGRAQQLRFDANVSRIGAEQAPQDLTYQLGVTYVRPGVINPDTNFTASLIGRQQELDTYRERAVQLRFGLRRDFGPEITGEAAIEIERSRVEDTFGTRDFLTVGPVARGQIDRRDDPLDATEGYFLTAQAGPFYELEFGNLAARGTIEGRIYRAIDAEDRFVLAGRGRLGSYVGPDQSESPPGQLFFAGGGGSIRGYGFRSIGVETIDNGTDVVGGRSIVEGSAELRTRFGERFGVVGFVDGGYVAEDSGFGGDFDWRFGAGLGGRYYTGFGPIRVDIATALNPRDQDPSVALYIGIGQSF